MARLTLKIKPVRVVTNVERRGNELWQITRIYRGSSVQTTSKRIA
jgi:hypothetical protein